MDLPCVFGPVTCLEWGLHLGPVLESKCVLGLSTSLLPRRLLEILMVHLNLGVNGE